MGRSDLGPNLGERQLCRAFGAYGHRRTPLLGADRTGQKQSLANIRSIYLSDRARNDVLLEELDELYLQHVLPQRIDLLDRYGKRAFPMEP